MGHTIDVVRNQRLVKEAYYKGAAGLLGAGLTTRFAYDDSTVGAVIMGGLSLFALGNSAMDYYRSGMRVETNAHGEVVSLKRSDSLF